MGQHERAGADALVPLRPLGAVRSDNEVIVRHQEREVGASFGEAEHHRVLAVGLDVGDVRDRAGAARRRVLTAMHVDRVDDIGRLEALAVVELDSLAQLEAPLGRVGSALPALRQFARQVTLRGDLHQVVSDLPTRVRIVNLDQTAAGEGVVGGSTSERLAKLAAALGRGRPGFLRQHQRRNRAGHPEGGHLPDEIPARDAPLRELALQFFDLSHC